MPTAELNLKFFDHFPHFTLQENYTLTYEISFSRLIIQPSTYPTDPSLIGSLSGNNRTHDRRLFSENYVMFAFNMYSTISHQYETILGYFSGYSQLTFEPLCGYFHYNLKRYSVLSTFD